MSQSTCPRDKKPEQCNLRFFCPWVDWPVMDDSRNGLPRRSGLVSEYLNYTKEENINCILWIQEGLWWKESKWKYITRRRRKRRKRKESFRRLRKKRLLKLNLLPELKFLHFAKCLRKTVAYVIKWLVLMRKVKLWKSELLNK